MTAAEIRKWIRKLRIDSNPTETRDRYQEAVDGRKLVGTLMYDVTATISAGGLAPASPAASIVRPAAINSEHLPGNKVASRTCQILACSRDIVRLTSVLQGL